LRKVFLDFKGVLGMGAKMAARRMTPGLRSRKRLGGTLSAIALAVGLMAITPALQAQTAPRIEFNLPAQDLNRALLSLADRAGIQIIYDAGKVQGLRSTAVSGSLTPQEALARMLEGTGYTYSQIAPGRLGLVEAPRGGSATTLPPISVEGQRGVPPQAEIGNLPPAYAGGQVARGGKLGILGNRDMMDTPFNQTSYTQKTIQNQQAATLADVLENDPAVRANFPGGSGIDQANIRGFAAGNQDIAFGGLYGVAPTSNGMMAVESVERLEVLKGPSALLNGMAPFGSIGGAINIVPKRAGETPLTEVTPSYYSDGQIGGHVDVGRRFGPDNAFGARFNGVYRDGDTAVDRQDQETGVATLGLDFRGEVVRLSADLGYQDQFTTATRRPVAFSAGLAVPDAPDSSSNYSQSWNFTENKNTYGALRGEFDITDYLTAFAAVGGGIRYGRSISENSTVNSASGTIAAGNATIQSNREEAETVEAGLRGNFTTGFIRHDMVAANTVFWKDTGLAFANSAIGSTNLYNYVALAKPTFASMPDPEDTLLQSRQQLTSFVITDTLSILEDKVQLTLGARRQRINTDNFNTTTGNRTSSYDRLVVSPAVGLVVKPIESLSIYGNRIQGLSQGSTAPTTGVSNPGEILPPFETEQHEVGVKYDFGRLAMTLAAFEVSQPSAYTQNGVFGAFGEQRHRGLEFGTFGEITDGIRILGGATYIDSVLTKTQNGTNNGKEGVAVPDLQANIGMEWDTPFVRDLTLSGRMVYTSTQYLNAANTQELPAWTRFDIGARYAIETHGVPIVIRANVLNVFDESYWASAAASSGRAGLSLPRTFLLSTSFQF
jgi:iron complex outermembrane receptor protein